MRPNTPQFKIPAIVIGLDTLPGLQTARILDRHGVPVIAIATDPHHHSSKTNVCREIHFADHRSGDFLDTLDAIRSTLDEAPVLFPCLDPAVLTLSRNRDRLGDRFRYALPPADAVEALTDKVRFFELAQSEGLPIPPTRILEERADAERAVEDFDFPAVLKPAVRLPEWDRNTRWKAFKVSDGEDLLRHYDLCRGWTDALIMQRWIEGGDDSLYSCNCFIDATGTPQASFVARKLRQWPPHIGFSSLGEECRDDFVLEQSLRLFASVPYHGLGYVEFKRDSESGETFIIEPNIGRPTGRSAIAEAGGVELLLTQYCELLGLPLPERRVQTFTGAKWIDLRHDIQSALYYWRRGELSAGEWWASFKGPKAYAYFSWRDPMPFLHDLLRAFWKIVKRRRPPAPAGSGLAGQHQLRKVPS
jgi:D-aspartate ligase